MKFNEHSKLAGLHSFLSPSQYHWVNYEDEKLIERYKTHQASVRGTRLHEFAKEAIELGIKLPRTGATINMYVNDAIGYKMIPEQPLFYSVNCFGTADTISFKNGLLRIHDLKTGTVPANPKQLEVYAALFCLEYRYKPSEIDMEFRIYQNDQRFVIEKDLHNIVYIIDRIVTFDRLIEQLKEQEER